MFLDEEYIDEQVDELKDMIENNIFYKDKCNNFMSYDELERKVMINKKEMLKSLIDNLESMNREELISTLDEYGVEYELES